MIKAQKIHIFAAPGGRAKFYTSSAKLRDAVGGADEVELYCNGGDAICGIDIAGLIPQLSLLPLTDSIAIGGELKFGRGGPPIRTWTFHSEAGVDQTKYHLGLEEHHIFSAPRHGHTRLDYWFNVLAAGRRHLMQSKLFPPMYWVTTGNGVETLTSSGWVVLDESGCGSPPPPGCDDWRLVGRNGESLLEYVAVLITSADESAEQVAEKLRQRNVAEHLGEMAMILLDGNAGRERNNQIIAALEQLGYARTDINIVIDGDLYSADGELLESGASLPADTQPVVALGIWAHELAGRFNRPVIADSLGPELRVRRARGSRRTAVSASEGDDPRKAVPKRRTARGQPRTVDLLGGPLGKGPPASSGGPRFEPPPPPGNGASRSGGATSPATAGRRGVYTVDERNLILVPAEEAGTGFILGAAEPAGPPPVPAVRVPFLLFPHEPPPGAER